MELDPVILSRLQFAFVVTFHIIFPAFTIGLAAWLATIEGARLFTGKAIYRRVFDFWLRVFAVSFGIGVVTGCPGVPADVLVPKRTWHDPAAYEATAAKLATLFSDNFRQYRDQVAPDVAAAGPRA